MYFLPDIVSQSCDVIYRCSFIITPSLLVHIKKKNVDMFHNTPVPVYIS